MLSTLAFLILMGSTGPQADSCNPWVLEKGNLVKLAGATSAAELHASFKSIIAPDGIVKLFYAVRLAEIEPGNSSDLMVIAAIPSSQLELYVMYHFIDPDCKVPASIAQFGGGGWIPTAQEAVLRQGRGTREFLMLSWLYRSNGEIGELLPGYTDEIKKRRPKEFDEAFRSLPGEVRAEIEAGRQLLPGK